LLCQLEKFNEWIWENACGEGHLSKELIKQGYQVYSSDLIDRGYGMNPIDFLGYDKTWHGDISIQDHHTKLKLSYCEKYGPVIDEEQVAMYLKINF
jgi:hypothetical protein